MEDKVVIGPNNGTWWIIWRTVIGEDDLRRGWWRGDGEDTSMTIFPTERHGIDRKLKFLHL